MMRYLSGTPYAPALTWEHGGLMLTPVMGNRLDLSGVTWAADNGCYSQGERFSLRGFLAFLDQRSEYRASCVFAVAPDVPFDAAATWDRSRPVLPLIRERGYPAALAVQNGIGRVGIAWDEIDAVMIAGDTAFKTSQAARRICHEATARGKWVHMARRNSGRAIQSAHDMGADSCDGTFLRFAPDTNWPRLRRWFDQLCTHDRLGAWGSDERFGLCRDCGRQIWRATA